VKNVITDKRLATRTTQVCLWNVVSLYCSSQEVGTSQDGTITMQVKDHKESERRCVMQRIRVETSPDANITILQQPENMQEHSPWLDTVLFRDVRDNIVYRCLLPEKADAFDETQHHTQD